MPNIKGLDIRSKILDRCLRKGGYSTVRLMEEVNKGLEASEYPIITTLNTIRQDMDYISSNYPHVFIDDKRCGRNVTYSYRRPDSSIFNLPFNVDELTQLSQCMAILSRFDGARQSEWIKSFIEQFQLSINIEADCTKIVGFDWSRHLKCQEFYTNYCPA